MQERRNAARSFLRVYWLCAAIVSVPVFATSVATGYWLGMGIGLMLCVMGVSGYRRAGASAQLSESASGVPDSRLPGRGKRNR
ncbi:MAG: hypothetical protein ACYCSI_02285 [Solirubrobacteraceae bacterium]